MTATSGARMRLTSDSIIDEVLSDPTNHRVPSAEVFNFGLTPTAFGNQTISAAALLSRSAQRRDSRLCVPASQQVCPCRAQSSPWEKISARLIAASRL